MEEEDKENQEQLRFFPLPIDAAYCLKCKQGFDPLYETRKLYYLQDCLHMFCKKCLAKQMNGTFLKKMGNIQCMECSLPMHECDYKKIMGDKRFEKLSQEVIRLMFKIVIC